MFVQLVSSTRVRSKVARPRRGLFALSTAGVLLLSTGAVSVSAADTTRISIRSDGTQGNSDSGGPAISAHGRFVAFTSLATNLVRHSKRKVPQVLLHDRKTGKTRRVSPPSVRASSLPSISSHGRYVAFHSGEGVFVRDMRTGKTMRASLDAGKSRGDASSTNPAISGSGRFVAFDSISTRPGVCRVKYTREVFVRDRQRGRTACLSVDLKGRPGRLGSWDPSISTDGRFVAFTSRAPNLVPDDTNRTTDIFVRDRKTHSTERVSVSSSGAQADNELGSTYAYSEHPSISANGRFVVFESEADNLVQRDTNRHQDIFIHDRWTDRTARVNVSSAHAQAKGDGYEPSVSGDGRFVVFYSWAANLVRGDENGTFDVFIRDRRLQETTLGDLSSSGLQARDGARNAAISADGAWLAFDSPSPLVPGDTRMCADHYDGRVWNCWDVFTRGPLQ